MVVGAQATEVDLVVIGSGPGGYVAAIRAAELGKKVTIIGIGGIFTAEDAYRKIKLGASYVELITGMIYGGPQVVAQINEGLVEFMRQDDYKNISEVVGVDVGK